MDSIWQHLARGCHQNFLNFQGQKSYKTFIFWVIVEMFASHVPRRNCLKCFSASHLWRRIRKEIAMQYCSIILVILKHEGYQVMNSPWNSVANDAWNYVFALELERVWKILPRLRINQVGSRVDCWWERPWKTLQRLTCKEPWEQEPYMNNSRTSLPVNSRERPFERLWGKHLEGVACEGPWEKWVLGIITKRPFKNREEDFLGDWHAVNP